jgi:hypothetical protein
MEQPVHDLKEHHENDRQHGHRDEELEDGEGC